MSNAYYNHSSSIAAGATAKADQVRGEFDEIASAFDLVDADFGKAFLFPTGVGKRFTDNAGARANKVLGFDANGDAAITSIGAFQGDWLTTTVYGYKDIVIGPAANGRNLYICELEHTAGTFATDLSNGKWALMADLGRIVNELKTADFTAVAGGDYMVDSTTPVVVTLPPSPAITDDPITITQVAGAASSITIDRNSNNIMGLAQNLTVDIQYASFRLMYCDAARGWRLSNI